MRIVNYFKIKNIDEKSEQRMEIEKALFNFMDEADGDLMIFEENGDIEEVYTFLDQEKTSKFEQVIDSFDCLLESRDITEDILMNRDPKTTISKEIFEDPASKKLIDSFLRDHLTKDMILDKILEQGPESLTDLDKEILQS